VNQGGEPAHDDYGLPRVDVQIPDDARELYRDVQAYHRELRALRRQQRSGRLRAPLRRTGIILPLAAGCLILALISGMVLTLFSSDPYFSGFGRPGTPNPGASNRSHRAAAPTAPRASAAQTAAAQAAPAGTTATRLPSKTISVAGKPLALRPLRSTALAIVPSDCGCTAAVQQLLAQAGAARVPVYLVGPSGNRAGLARLAAISGQTAVVATDARNVLGAAFQSQGLTALLIDAHGRVTVAPGLQPGLDLQPLLRQLHPAS